MRTKIGYLGYLAFVISIIACNAQKPKVVQLWPNSIVDQLYDLNNNLEEFDVHSILSTKLPTSFQQKLRDLSKLIGILKMFMKSNECSDQLSRTIGGLSKLTPNNSLNELLMASCKVELRCIEIFFGNIVKKIDSVEQKNFAKVYDKEIPMRDVANSIPLFYDYMCSALSLLNDN